MTERINVGKHRNFLLDYQADARFSAFVKQANRQIAVRLAPSNYFEKFMQ